MTPDEYHAAVVGTAAVGAAEWLAWLPADEVKRVARLYVKVTLGARYCGETMFIPRDRSSAPAARPVERVIEVSA
jgi:hypothetical protein